MQEEILRHYDALRAETYEVYGDKTEFVIDEDNRLVLVQNPSSIVIVPIGVTELLPGCFSYCIGVSEVYLPDSCTTLGAYCFYACQKLEVIHCTSSIERVEEGVFDGLVKLELVTDTRGIKYLGRTQYIKSEIVDFQQLVTPLDDISCKNELGYELKCKALKLEDIDCDTRDLKLVGLAEIKQKLGEAFNVLPKEKKQIPQNIMAFYGVLLPIRKTTQVYLLGSSFIGEEFRLDIDDYNLTLFKVPHKKIVIDSPTSVFELERYYRSTPRLPVFLGENYEEIDLELVGTSPEYILAGNQHLSTRFYISPKTVDLIVFRTTARKFSTLNFYLPPDIEVKMERGPLKTNYRNGSLIQTKHRTTTNIAVEVNVLPLNTLAIESYENRGIDTEDEYASFQVHEFGDDKRPIDEISTKSLYYTTNGFVYPITASHDEFDW